MLLGCLYSKFEFNLRVFVNIGIQFQNIYIKEAKHGNLRVLIKSYFLYSYLGHIICQICMIYKSYVFGINCICHKILFSHSKT